MQDKRRTTIETLTSEQQAFLHPEPQDAPPPARDIGVEATAFSKPAVVSVNRDSPNFRAHTPSSQRDTQGLFSLQVRDRHPTLSVTLRLSAPIARSLRQASIQRSLDYQEPYTQQGIAEAALSAWLERNGYYSDE